MCVCVCVCVYIKGACFHDGIQNKKLPLTSVSSELRVLFHNSALFPQLIIAR